MPKRPRSGAVRRPARVVAATRVKGFSGIFMDRAPGPAADHEVEAVVLEGGVEDLLDLGVEAVDLVDEEDLAGLERGEEGGEVAGAFDDGARGGLDGRRASSAAIDVGEARLADARRPEEQHVVEGLAAARAASMATRRLATTCGWPTYSSSRRGRSETSNPRSSSMGRP